MVFGDSRVDTGRGIGKLHPVKISIVAPAFNEERLLGDSLVQMTPAVSEFVTLK